MSSSFAPAVVVPVAVVGWLARVTTSAAIGLPEFASERAPPLPDGIQGSFRIRRNVRCIDHYRVASWGVQDDEACQGLCLADDRCATYSRESSGDRGCLLFSSDASCVAENGWTTGHRDTRCGLAQENSATTLSCPFGSVISSVKFASYGTPSGQCYNFTQGSCHEATTKEIVEDLCVGESECTLSASNLVFGEPCPVVSKSLKVQIECQGEKQCKASELFAFPARFARLFLCALDRAHSLCTLLTPTR
jgi:hypothetical protein